jgi:hypothetical protein
MHLRFISSTEIDFCPILAIPFRYSRLSSVVYVLKRHMELSDTNFLGNILFIFYFSSLTNFVLNEHQLINDLSFESATDLSALIIEVVLF